jgi:hypothetical protein
MIFVSFLLMGAVVNVSLGQGCDYVTSRYQVEVIEEVFYGVDTLFNGEPDSLFLNIFKPVGDNNDNRPMVMWCFGGGFFAGEKESFNEVCADMASRGFVAVTIDYRLGYVNPNFFPYPFAYDTNEIQRAGFRAAQDAKGALRFMKAREDIDNIDIENVFIGGASAGAITALAATFIDQEEEKDPSILGSIERPRIFNAVDRPDLGPVEGRLNLNGYDATVKGVLNIFGAVPRLDFITAEDEEVIYSYHQTLDPIVPCDRRRAYWNFPGVPNDMPLAYGSCSINNYLKTLGRAPEDNQAFIYDGGDHAIHNEEEVFGEIYDFLQFHICGPVASVEDEEFEGIKVWPNPSDGIVRVSGLTHGDQWQVMDLFGKTVMSFTAVNEEMELNLPTKGHYILSCRESGVFRKVVVR